MKLRCALTTVLLSVGVTFPIVAPTEVCAAESNSAALVVDLGDEDGVFRYCVVLPDDSVTGAELIQLAGEQHGLDYRIHQGGVCRLAGVGPASGDCFGEYPYFWGYWRGDSNRGWSWSSLGAGSTSVRAGDTEGWAWGTGQDGSSHPQPPPTAYEDVCKTPEKPAGGDEPDSSGPGDDEPGMDETEEVAPDADQSSPASSGRNGHGARQREEKYQKRKGRENPARATPTPPLVSPSPQPSHAPVGATTGTPGPPLAGLLGAFLALVVVGGGYFASRREAPEPRS